MGWELLICSRQNFVCCGRSGGYVGVKGEICEAAFAKHGELAELDYELSNKLC